MFIHPIISIAQKNSPDSDWPVYGGNKAGNRFSPLTQINRDNVKDLQIAWTYDTGDNSNPNNPGIDWQCQPIVVKDVMYAVSPKMKLFALNAMTGKELWSFNPFSNSATKPSIHAVRGVAYWEDGDDKRIIYTVGPTIFEINATTGQRETGFGENGEADLHAALKDNEVFGKEPGKYSIRNTSP
ncbi:MAG TPA: hypothetical protein VGC01_10695, partial [Mucilaginibacter sp.]